MATLKLGDNELLIETEFHERHVVRQVPGVHWDAARRVWTAPLSWGVCKAARGVFGEWLSVDPDVYSWAWSIKAWADDQVALREARDAEPVDHSERLRPFQRAGARFLAQAQRAIIADEMGTGKTAQMIAALEELNAYPVLVICPNTVKRTWEAEYGIWAPHRTVAIVGGPAKKRVAAINSGADVVVINWEALRTHSRLAPFGSITMTEAQRTDKELNLVKWAAVIGDEAHRVRDHRSQQTRAFWYLAGQADVRFAATGSPMESTPDELWSLVRAIAPEDWPSRSHFIDRYCATQPSPWGGFQVLGLNPFNEQEFRDILYPRFIRRPKSAVLPDLPPKVYTRRLVDMGDKQRKAYEDMADYMLAQLDEGVIVATNALAHMTRLIGFASAYGEIVGNDQVRLREPSCKVDALVDLLDELQGKQVVVFADRRQLIDISCERLDSLGGYRYGRITGSESPDARQVVIDQFQAGQIQAVLATIGAGGEGITLTAADTVVFLQRGWSSIQNIQAEDRLHRIGQAANSVQVIDVITRGTIDEARVALLGTKLTRVQEVVRDLDVVRQWMSWTR